MQRVLQLWSLLIGRIENGFKISVLIDEFCSRLFAYTWHAFQVVAWVAAQCCIVGILRRSDACSLKDSGFVI